MLPLLLDLGFFKLYSYPLFLGLSWGIAYHYCRTVLDHENNAPSIKHFHWFFWGNFLFSWVGSKLFYILVSAQGGFTDYAQSLSFWVGGGLVFYGGLVFSLIYSLLFFTLKPGLKSLYVQFVPGLAFAHGLGRIGCFLAGCCFGEITHSGLGVHINGAERFPVQLMEASALIVLGLFFHLYKRDWGKRILPYYLISYSILRFFLEFLRGDEIRGGYASLSTSQWISMAIFILANLYLLRERFSIRLKT